MNKIYKVIWSKVKHQYVVVSELAHSNGKQSRTSRNSIRSRIAALVVCGAIAAFGVFGAGPNSAFAAGVGTMTDSKYIAFVTPDSEDRGQTASKDNVGSHIYLDNHKYTSTKVYTPNGDPVYYWVRDGYTIKLEEDTRFQGADKSYVVRAYKSASADTEDIVQSYQNDIKESNIYTISGDKLHNTNTGVYAGGSNGYTPVKMTRTYDNREHDYSYSSDPWIQKNGTWEAADWDDFKSVTLNSTTGLYEYKGQVVNPENVYVIQRNDNGKTTNQIGVFVVDNQVYTGAVHGVNNEVLMTAIGEDGNYYTYWASEVYDPTATIGTMTVSAFNKRLSDIEADITTVHKDDIKGIEVKQAEGSSSNGGTIGLEINNDFNEDGSPTGGKYIPGTITIKNTENSGKNGNDVKIQFGSINEEGADVPKFTVDAGSKVVGKTGADGTTEANPNDTLTGIEINGQNYKLGGGKTYTDGAGIAIDDENDNKISVRLKDDETNLTVDDTGLALNKDLTVDSVNAKGTTIDEKGLTVGGTTYVSAEGLSAGNKVITNVANGVIDSDAVNLGQLKDVEEKADDAVEVAGKHTIVSTEDNNLKVENVAEEGQAANYEVALNKDLTVDSVNAKGTTIDENGLTVGGTTYVSKEGLNAGGKAITNVANGVIDSDAVNLGQLKDVEEKADDAVDEAGKHTIVSTEDNNLTVENVAEEGQAANYEVALNKDLTVDSVNAKGTTIDENGLTVGGTTYVSKEGLNAGGKAITNVANGVIDSDAVNLGQLKDVEEKADDAVDEAGKHTIVSTEDNNLTVENVAEEGQAANYEVALNKDLTVDSVNAKGTTIDENGLTVGGTTYVSKEGLNAGGKAITNVANGVIDSDAVNLGQLKDVEEKADDAVEVAGKHTIVSTEDNNLKVENVAEEGQAANYEVALNKDLTVDSVNAKGTTIDENGLTVGGTTYVSKEGLNAGGKAITNVANGVIDSDAVNLGQLKDVEEKADDAVEVAGKHTIVSTEDNNFKVENVAEEGQAANYEVALNKDLTVDSVNAKGTTIDENGLTVGGTTYVSKEGLNAGGKAITNVANGVIDSDAVNLGQLKDVEEKADDAVEVAGKHTIVSTEDNNLTVEM